MANATAKPKPAAKPKARSGASADGKAQVDAYMAKLDHPHKATVEALRRVILAAAPGITQQVKWNAPSFRTAKDYLCTFNLRDPEAILLVFHNPLIPTIASDLLEGDYKDRRLAYFHGPADAKAKTPELRRVVAALVQEMNT